MIQILADFLRRPLVKRVFAILFLILAAYMFLVAPFYGFSPTPSMIHANPK